MAVGQLYRVVPITIAITITITIVNIINTTIVIVIIIVIIIPSPSKKFKCVSGTINVDQGKAIIYFLTNANQLFTEGKCQSSYYLSDKKPHNLLAFDLPNRDLCLFLYSSLLFCLRSTLGQDCPLPQGKDTRNKKVSSNQLSFCHQSSLRTHRSIHDCFSIINKVLISSSYDGSYVFRFVRRAEKKKALISYYVSSSYSPQFYLPLSERHNVL